MGTIIGTIIGVLQGDTRSLDHSSLGGSWVPMNYFSVIITS